MPLASLTELCFSTEAGKDILRDMSGLLRYVHGVSEDFMSFFVHFFAKLPHTPARTSILLGFRNFVSLVAHCS